MFDEAFTKNSLTPALALFGAIFGLIGTLLGILNYRLSRKQHSVRVSVDVKGGGENEIVKGSNGEEVIVPRVRELTIKVVNQSYFAVTVVQAGFVIRPHLVGPAKYFSIDMDKPTRMESRHVESFKCTLSQKAVEHQTRFAQLARNDGHFKLSECSQVFVLLATGERFTGGNKNLAAAKGEIDNLMNRLLPKETA